MGVKLHNCKGITKGVGAPPLYSVECGKDLARWSCPCRLRINLPGSPVDSHRGKKAWTRELSWPPSGPLSPGDALAAGPPDTRHRLRSPPFALSHHHSLLTDPRAAARAA